MKLIISELNINSQKNFDESKNSLSIDLNQFIFLFVLIFHLFFKNLFYDRVTSVGKNFKKLQETMFKLSLLNNIPKIQSFESLGDLTFISLEIRSLPVTNNFESGFPVTIAKDICLKINMGDKILITGDDHMTVNLLLQLLVNLRQNLQKGYIKLHTNKGEIDLAILDLENWRKLFFIGANFEFQDNKTILQNFQQIVPNISETEVVNCLKKASIYKIKANTVYVYSIPKKIKLKILIALIFALEKNKKIIAFDGSILDSYDSEHDLYEVLNNISNLKTTIIMSYFHKNTNEQLKEVFDSIYHCENGCFNKKS